MPACPCFFCCSFGAAGGGEHGCPRPGEGIPNGSLLPSDNPPALLPAFPEKDNCVNTAALALSLLALSATSVFAAPKHHPPRVVSKHAEAASVGETQVDGVLSGVADKLWAQNDVYWHTGDYPRIIALDKIIVQADPHFIECYTTGAWLMWSDGANAEAEAFYKQCVRDNPSTSLAYYDYGFFLYNHLHRYADARQVFARSAALSDAGVLDYRMLAHSYEKLKQYDKAVGVWRRIKARWPQGAPQDGTHGAVDTNNLNKDLLLLKGTPAR